MTELLSEIILFLVRAKCELRLASYGSKRASQTLFSTPFCVYLHAQLEKLKVVLGHSTYQMTALLLEISIFWVRSV